MRLAFNEHPVKSEEQCHYCSTCLNKNGFQTRFVIYETGGTAEDETLPIPPTLREGVTEICSDEFLCDRVYCEACRKKHQEAIIAVLRSLTFEDSETRAINIGTFD